MENQKKWAGWLIAGLVAAVGVVAIVMTTGTAEPPAATQPPVVTVSPSASASPEATQPTPSPAASGRTANASAIGYLAMRNATVSGAVGGCQAEVGVASAMAASAAVELMGGTPNQCREAASTALMNLLGLVCDPVGGLVEYPCQNRNAIGAAGALTAAELALCGVKQLIPLDEMLAAMYNVGRRLSPDFRETAMGGCAVTPSACAACGKCS